MLTKISTALSLLRRVDAGGAPGPRLSTLVDAGYSTLFRDSRPPDLHRDLEELQRMLTGKSRTQFRDLVLVTIDLARGAELDSLPTETLAAALDQLEMLPTICESDSALRVGVRVWRVLTQRTQHDRPPRRLVPRQSAPDPQEPFTSRQHVRLDSTWWGFEPTHTYCPSSFGG